MVRCGFGARSAGLKWASPGDALLASSCADEAAFRLYQLVELSSRDLPFQAVTSIFGLSDLRKMKDLVRILGWFEISKTCENIREENLDHMLVKIFTSGSIR